MSAPQKLTVTNGMHFRPGANLFPGAIGPGSKAFNELVMPFLVAYLGGTDVQKIIDADFLKITIENRVIAAGSPANSTPAQIKESVSLHGKLIYFTGVVYDGYKYELRLNQDTFATTDLMPRLKATTPLTPVAEAVPPPTPPPPKAAPVPAPIPQPRAVPPPTPKPAPVPIVVVEEPVPAPATTPVEAVVVTTLVPEEPEPVPAFEAQASVVAKVEVEEEKKPTPIADPPVEEKSDASASEPPAKAATRKSAPARKTPAPEKKAASAKKKPPTKRPAVRKVVAKKPEPKSSVLPKAETHSRVSIKPEVTDLDREIAYKAALLAELQQLRKDTLAKAAEIETRLAKTHGQKH